MKKISSLILLIISVISISIVSVKANGDTSSLTDLLNSTNTYNCNSNYDGEIRGIARYDLTTRNNNVVSSETMMTILTPGLGGRAYNFSNDGENNFAKQRGSLVDGLLGTFNTNFNLIFIDMRLNYDNCKIYDISSKWDNASYGESITLNGSRLLNQSSYLNTSKHTIVLFDFSDFAGSYDGNGNVISLPDDLGYQSNDFVYSYFNRKLSELITIVKNNTNNILPKMNLIGHSRGGLTNFQYALDHPDMVNQIYSIGTPYVGSTSAQFDIDGLSYKVGSRNYCHDGEDDIVNAELYTIYKERWNDNQTLYSNIRVSALGGYQTLDYLIKMINSPGTLSMIRSEFDDEISIDMNTEKLLIDTLMVLVSPEICFAIALDLYFQTFAPAYIARINEIINNSNLNSRIATVFTEVFGFLANEIEFRLSEGIVWENDALVHLPSQLGEGYYNFERYTKKFTSLNSNFSRMAEDTAEVVHNLEPQDASFINYIVSRIEMSGKTTADFSVYDISDTEVGIGACLKGTLTEEYTIPRTIDGKLVVEIGEGAFSGVSGVRELTLPNSVTSICKNAFSDMANLEDVEIVGDLSYFEYDNAFAGSDNLKNIDIISSGGLYRSSYGVLYDSSRTRLLKYPCAKNAESYTIDSNVRDIAGYAFYGARNLTSINLNNVTFVDEYAFAGCTNLNNITANHLEGISRSSIDETPWYYHSMQNQRGLITLGKVVVKYVPSDSSHVELHLDSEYVCICDGAFEDIDELVLYCGGDIELDDEYDPNNTCVRMIKDGAFKNIGEIKIYLYNPIPNLETTFDNVGIINVMVARTLRGYYMNLMDYDSFDYFDGVSNDLCYRVLKFINFVDDPQLYINDIRFVLREGESILLNDDDIINYRDSSGNYITYVLEGLYYENGLINRVVTNELRYEDCANYYAHWNIYWYTINYDYNGGYGVASQRYCFYHSISLPTGTKPYCDGIDRFIAPSGQFYYMYNTYFVSSFFSSGMTTDYPYVTLRAIWDETVYRVDYKYLDGSEARSSTTYTYYRTATLGSYSSNTYDFYGWYDRNMTTQYPNTFIERYHENLVVYAALSIHETDTITSSLTITDSGRFNQGYDVLNVSSLTGQSVSSLMSQGYSRVRLTLGLFVREKDDGYQWVFIYKDRINNDSYLIASQDFEHGPGYKDPNVSVHVITFEFYLSNLIDDRIWILYGASGSGSDTWYRDRVDIILDIYKV